MNENIDIEKVAEGVIGEYRFIAFKVPAEEIGKHYYKARRHLAEKINMRLEVLSDDIRERVVKRIMESHERIRRIINEEGVPLDDIYVPETEEVAASYIMTELLSRIPGAPYHASVFYENGVPAYSLYYYNAGELSYGGAWYWDLGKDPKHTVCVYVIDRDMCSIFEELIFALKPRVDEVNKYLFFAVWRQR